MADHDAFFGGEHSGHYYFRQFWRADTGMLAAPHNLRPSNTEPLLRLNVEAADQPSMTQLRQ